MNHNGIVIKPYTSKELAALYKVSAPTFRNWLKPFAKEIGKRTGNYFSARQVEIIFNCLGWPVSQYEDTES